MTGTICAEYLDQAIDSAPNHRNLNTVPGMSVPRSAILYFVQICYTMFLVHWATKEISPMTVLVQNDYLLPQILVSYPLFFNQISILASHLYHAIRDCYCCLLFQETVHFSYQHVPIGMTISSVNHFRTRVVVSLIWG